MRRPSAGVGPVAFDEVVELKSIGMRVRLDNAVAVPVEELDERDLGKPFGQGVAAVEVVGLSAHHVQIYTN